MAAGEALWSAKDSEVSSGRSRPVIFVQRETISPSVHDVETPPYEGSIHSPCSPQIQGLIYHSFRQRSVFP